MLPFETLTEQRVFSGTQGFYRHESAACAGPMRFGVFVPPQASHAPVPVVYFLAGLSCSEETFAIKAGAQRVCAELGLMLVTPDTSPRSARFPTDSEHWDFGQGAGFYLDATEAPWSAAYRMERYVVHELPALIEANFPARTDKRGVFGHSMGGHGALTLAFRNPGRYTSVSAIAPIVAPSQVPWGQKAFRGYLGEDTTQWAEHDACALVGRGGVPLHIRIDQGLSDKFLERELRPELFEDACRRVGQSLEVVRHAGYDHSYYFVQTVVTEHLRHHAGP